MKETLIRKIDSKNMDESLLEIYAQMIKAGKTVIFPTETVYGLGANALDEHAALNIYKAKGRPSDNPLIVHISEMDQLEVIATGISEKAIKIMEEFWPGPLTLVFRKKDCIPYATTGGLETVAVRMPSHPVARKLISLSGVPIAAPSANISGRPSPTKPDHVKGEMDGRVDGIILEGPCEVGLESTVLDVTGEIPVILRPGGITMEQIQSVAGRVDVDPGISGMDKDAPPMSPGMKYKHYSPNAQVYVVSGEHSDVVDMINGLCDQNRGKGLRTGVMCMEERLHAYKGCNAVSLGSSIEDVAAKLFDALIEMDEMGVDVVYSESFEECGIGMAVMNRLLKSSGYRVIKA